MKETQVGVQTMGLTAQTTDVGIKFVLWDRGLLCLKPSIRKMWREGSKDVQKRLMTKLGWYRKSEERCANDETKCTNDAKTIDVKIKFVSRCRGPSRRPCQARWNWAQDSYITRPWRLGSWGNQPFSGPRCARWGSLKTTSLSRWQIRVNYEV